MVIDIKENSKSVLNTERDYKNFQMETFTKVFTTQVNHPALDNTIGLTAVTSKVHLKMGYVVGMAYGRKDMEIATNMKENT